MLQGGLGQPEYIAIRDVSGTHVSVDSNRDRSRAVRSRCGGSVERISVVTPHPIRVSDKVEVLGVRRQSSQLDAMDVAIPSSLPVRRGRSNCSHVQVVFVRAVLHCGRCTLQLCYPNDPHRSGVLCDREVNASGPVRCGAACRVAQAHRAAELVGSVVLNQRLVGTLEGLDERSDERTALLLVLKRNQETGQVEHLLDFGERSVVVEAVHELAEEVGALLTGLCRRINRVQSKACVVIESILREDPLRVVDLLHRVIEVVADLHSYPGCISHTSHECQQRKRRHHKSTAAHF
mmetsp:Transcript_10874/g.44518  ORF Transcript_10874/g.44518 Transcript_10874/m.44518 type:complete len:292 (+) Transcript_10874:906-1781(+)